MRLYNYYPHQMSGMKGTIHCMLLSSMKRAQYCADASLQDNFTHAILVNFMKQRPPLLQKTFLKVIYRVCGCPITTKGHFYFLKPRYYQTFFIHSVLVVITMTSMYTVVYFQSLGCFTDLNTSFQLES